MLYIMLGKGICYIHKAQPSINFINRKGKFNISFKSFQLEIEIQILHSKYFRPNQPILI